MRKLSINQVEPGSQLAIDIKISSPHPDTLYQLRIERGTPLTKNHLQKLEKAGREFVFIHDPETDDLEKYMFDEQIDTIEEDIEMEMKQVENDIQSGNFKRINTKKMRKAINELVNALKKTKTMLAFTSLKTHDDYTGKHSLDVCRLTLALVLSHKQVFAEKACAETAVDKFVTDKYILEDLGIGALLHDIGKWEIPDNILNKPGKLTEHEWEAMQKHPDIGNELLLKLQKKGLIRSPVRMPALCHHEKYGGGGYPNNLQEDQIHIYGRITACSDVYSALTSNRPYRVAMTPNRALQTMKEMQKQQQHFDPWVYRLFLDMVMPFPIGQEVVLSDGTRGVVCDLPGERNQPLVRVLYRGNKRLKEPYEIEANTANAPTIVN
ncbi:MAG: HD-GYP domain-containing protein [bacterium]